MNTLAPDLLAVVERYRTCELATIGRDGVPIAWPTTPVRRPDGTFLVTTSIGLPQKAFNVRRDPRVAMLFSDPTGSGLDGAPQLLVQGTAVCPDEIVTDAAGAEDLWHRLAVRQPASRNQDANALSRRFMDWYYMRLHITVTPVAVLTRPPVAPVARGRLTGTASGLDPFPTAVLGLRDADGMPRLLRVNLAPGTDGAVTVAVPDTAEVRPGPAGLLGHSHDENLWNLRTAAVLGELREAGGTWTFVPRRAVPGASGSPFEVLRWIRMVRRNTNGYLARRGLARPRIDWAAHAAAKAGPTAAS